MSGAPLVLSVVIPAHNEAQSIGPVVEDLAETLDREGVPHEIVVVDDQSSDDTRGVVAAIAAGRPAVRCVSNPGPNGFGYAVRCGLDAYTGDAVAIVMGDGSDSPADVVSYYRKLLEGWDCVFGSRFMRGSAVIDYPWLKYLLNRLANWFIRTLFGFAFNDVTNAFKCYRREVIDGARPLLSPHFNLTVELPLKAIARGYSYAVVPIAWRNRTHGVAKLKIEEMGSRYLYIVLNVWLERLLTRGDYYRRPGGAAARAPNGPRPLRWGPFAALALLAAVIALPPFFALAPYNRPIVDDFLFAKQVEAQGYWHSQWIYYSTIYGRYTALALISLNPMTFGPRYIVFLRFTPIAVLAFLIGSAAYLARSVPGLDARRHALAVASALLVSYAAAMPSVWQGFYWWSSQCCFEVGNALGALTLGMWLRLPWRSSVLPARQIARVGVVTFLAMGTNELTALNLTGAFVLLSVVHALQRPLPRLYWVVAAMTAVSAGAALLSPGNLNKIGYSGGLPLALATRGAFAASGIWIAQWLTRPITMLMSIAALVLFAAVPVAARPQRRWILPASLAIAWLVLFLDLLVLFRSVGAGPHPLRSMNAIFFSFLVAWFGALRIAAPVLRRFLLPVARPAVAFAASGLFVIAVMFQPNNVEAAYDDLFSGAARTYAREADARFAAFRHSPFDVVEVSRYSAYPSTVTDLKAELTSDVTSTLNICVENYFNKAGVRVTDDRTLTAIQGAAGKGISPGQRVLVYVPRGQVSPAVQLLHARNPPFMVGDAPDLRRYVQQQAFSSLRIIWEDRNREDLAVRFWLRHAARVESHDGVTVADLSVPGFDASLAEFRAARTAQINGELDLRLADRARDPFLRWMLLEEYAWTRQEFPEIYQRIVRLPAARPEDLPSREIARGIRVYDYRLALRPDGQYTLFLFFRIMAALPEDDTVLVHVMPRSDDVGRLPAWRQQFRYDDWSFPPDTPTSKWRPEEITVLQTTVETQLEHASLRVGLHSPVHGTIGAADFPERPIARAR